MSNSSGYGNLLQQPQEINAIVNTRSQSRYSSKRGVDLSSAEQVHGGGYMCVEGESMVGGGEVWLSALSASNWRALLREGTYDVLGEHAGKEDGSSAGADSYVC